METRLKIMTEFSIPAAADFGMVKCVHKFHGKEKNDSLILVRVLREKVKLILEKYPKMDGFIFFQQRAPYDPPKQTRKR